MIRALTENAQRVLEARYLSKNAEGEIIEDWDGLCRRVATFIASAERDPEDERMLAAEFHKMMFNRTFLPNSPTLFNAGKPLGNLSGCFVLPIEDSLTGIFESLTNAVMVFRTGGGCGYDFSDLRKSGSPVSMTSGVSSGPVSFISVFNASTEVIKQGGKRRGANMGVLRVDHPDIELFLDAKKEEGNLANFNLSVALTDKFMRAVQEGLAGKDDGFDLIDNYTNEVDSVVSATALFNKLVEGAWANGEPGLLFIDEMNRKHPLSGLGKIKAVNPCGEQPLLPYESCNLGSLNLTHFYYEGGIDGIDWESLRKHVELAVNFLDNVCTMNRFPVPAISEATARTRKIGLGIMGWADLLILLGIPYDSPQARKLGTKLMEFIHYNALNESCTLAKALGSYPAFGEHYKLIEYKEEDCDWTALQKRIEDHGLRNACVTSIAPTGSISLLAGVSSGIEPNFQWQYSYHRVDQDFEETQWLAEGYLNQDHDLPEFFQTSLDIAPQDHIKMQAAFQPWVDSGISKTINMVNEATRSDVSEAILFAWRKGLKGFTLYRSGSRTQEVIVAKSDPKEDIIEELNQGPRKRPEITDGRTMKVSVGDDCGSMYVTLNTDTTGPCESFITLGRSGGCINSHVEALGRIISLALRSDVPISEILEQLKGIRCSKVRRLKGGDALRSCPDAVAYAFNAMLAQTAEGDHPLDDTPKILVKGASAVQAGENPDCPECGSQLEFEGHCLACRCGYTKCG